MIDAFNVWYESHKHLCRLNYEGSAGGMEVVGAKTIFERNVETHNMRYIKYLGDGDSKSFAQIENTYDGIKVEKLKCVGHVQKRVGTRLRELKKQNKDLKGKTDR